MRGTARGCSGSGGFSSRIVRYPYTRPPAQKPASARPSSPRSVSLLTIWSIVSFTSEGAKLDAGPGGVGRHPGAYVDDADVGGREIAEDDLPGVAEVAGEARQVVDEDRLEAAARGASFREEPLKVGALEVGATLGRVLEH